MTDIDQLTDLCENWRILLKAKNAQYDEIKNPLDRIEPACHLINIWIEKDMMEDELCEHFYIPPHLYQPTSMITVLKKTIRHEGIRTVIACALAAYFFMMAVPQRYFSLTKAQQREQIRSIKLRVRRKTNQLLDLEEYDCY